MHPGPTPTRPRTILYTGKGGVGKTSVAAATARRLASQGLRTLVLSTDPAHSLSDSLDCELATVPTKLEAKLWAQEIDAQAELERHWDEVRSWLAGWLIERGVDRISADELTVPPGMDELFSLLQIKRHHDEGEFDAIVVDCAPTGETLRLLSFPEVAQWWLEKVFPVEGNLMNAVRPLARQLLDVSLPSEEALGDIHKLVQNLISMSEILRDREHSTVRLVMNADRMVVSEAKRTFTYLNLYGYQTDAVVVNRLFPDELADGYFGSWMELQRERMDEVRSGFAPTPVLSAPYFEQEVVGATMLDRLGESLFGEFDAGAVLYDGRRQEFKITDEGAELRLDFPFSEKAEIGLKKIGHELVVRAGQAKRTIVLPAPLGSSRATGAKFEDGALLVTLELQRDGDSESASEHTNGAARSKA